MTCSCNSLLYIIQVKHTGILIVGCYVTMTSLFTFSTGFSSRNMTTHRLHQTVCTASVHEALVDRWHPHTGVGSGLPGVPAWTGSHGEAAGRVAPQRLAGAGGFIHQDHRSVDELAFARCGSDARGSIVSGCCRVGPGGRRHRGHAAGSRVQAVLRLRDERDSGRVK